MFIEKYYRLNAFLHYQYFQKIKRRKNNKRKKINFDPSFKLEKLINKIAIPKNKIIFLHVGLKKLKNITDKSYQALTEEIINLLQKYLSPLAIVVPTFTWAFVKSGIYSVNYSKSEAGIFSEIFRKLANYRTPNAIQSFSILTENIDVFNNINHKNTFSNDGIYEFFRKNETYIIDISTDTFRDSPLHHIERYFQLDYLKAQDNRFDGFIIDKNNNAEEIKQLHGGAGIYNGAFSWNKEKIERFLFKKKILKSYKYKNIKVAYFNNYEQYEIFDKILKLNPYYLVTL